FRRSDLGRILPSSVRFRNRSCGVRAVRSVTHPEILRHRWQIEADGIGLPTGHALEAEVCGRTTPAVQPPLAWDDVVDALSASGRRGAGLGGRFCSGALPDGGEVAVGPLIRRGFICPGSVALAPCCCWSGTGTWRRSTPH